jgi:hypothetical protein
MVRMARMSVALPTHVRTLDVFMVISTAITLLCSHEAGEKRV